MRKKPPAGALPAKTLPPRDLGLGALIFCATLIAYWPALRGGPLWDDVAHVTRPGLRSFHGLWRIWSDLTATQQYYPLLHSAFWVEHRFFGDRALPYGEVRAIFKLLTEAGVTRAALATLRDEEHPAK